MTPTATTHPADPGTARPVEALSRRLAAVAGALGEDVDPQAVPSADLAAELLARLTAGVKDRLTPARLWLLLTAVGGRMPVIADVEEGLRSFDLLPSTECEVWLLRGTRARRAPGDGVRDLALVSGVVVDVGETAVTDLHTGIQQVVRATVPRWVRDHDVHLVGWWPAAAGLRDLGPAERARVLTWGSPVPGRGVGPAPVLRVPWEATVVLPDTARVPQRAVLACLARFSGNVVSGIGYDVIPAVSAHLVPPGSAGEFVRYLEQVKHTHRIAAISATAAAEFDGFVSALPTQGLRGPVVSTCVLGSDPARSEPPPPGGPPQIACIGSYEPRKNHLGLLYAAERLWREGLDFRLVLVGGMSWTQEIPARIAELQEAGRPLEARHAIDDDALDAVYSASRFTVFPSLHEGYGLPVAESLARGIPVITAGHGSTGEIAAAGGALTVDVRDDEQLVDAMRRLLTDDTLLTRLRAEAAARPRRSWDDYASELWSQLVGPPVPPA